MSADLIERLEKAEEGSHSLDADIYRWWRSITPPPADGSIWTTDSEYAPPYTTSIDAALTLLAEGHAVDSLYIWPGSKSTARIVETHKERDGGYWHSPGRDGRSHGYGETPAIALCAAALKLRAATVAA